MKRWFNRSCAFILALFVLLTIGGLSAQWIYPSNFDLLSSADLIAGISTFEWPVLDISGQFLAILNSEVNCEVTINGVTYTDSAAALEAVFNNSPENSGITLHNNSYVGSMQTIGEDVAALRALFGDVLLDEENKNEEFYIMIKREPIDGKTHTGLSYYMEGDHGWAEENTFFPGSEMVLFTTDWSTYNNNGNYVVVYASVYTRYPLTDADGNFLYDLDENGNIQYYTYTNQSGQTVTTTYPIYQYGSWVSISGTSDFAGYAQVVNYSTGDTTKSFDTGTWRSTAVYHSVAAGATLAAIIQSIVSGG